MVLGVSFKSSLQNDDVAPMSSNSTISLVNNADDVRVTSSKCISCVAVLRGEPQFFPKYDTVLKRWRGVVL